MLDTADRNELLNLARNTIKHALYRRTTQAETRPLSATLRECRASFVTLKCDGLLRGCIGTLEPARPLYEDVAHNAHAAAFRDPRFTPLALPEADAVRIEISVLERPELIVVTNRAELLATLRPGHDGLIVEAGFRRATFLPAVWDSLADPEEFVTHLWQKAGLPCESWPSGIRLLRYATEQFEETGPTGELSGQPY